MLYSPDQAIDRRPELLAAGLTCIGVATTSIVVAYMIFLLGYCSALVALLVLVLIGVPCCLDTGTRKLYRFWCAAEHQRRLDLKRQWNSKKRLQKVHGSPQTSFDASAKRGPHSNMSRKTLAAPLTELSARKSSRMAHEQSSEPPSQSPPIPPPLPRVSHSQTPPQQSIASSKELSGSRGGFSPLHPPPPPGSAPYFRVSSSGYTIPDAPAAQPPTPQSQKFRHKSVSFSGREGSRKDAEARVLDFEGSAGDQGDLLS